MSKDKSFAIQPLNMIAFRCFGILQPSIEMLKTINYVNKFQSIDLNQLAVLGEL